MTHIFRHKENKMLYIIEHVVNDIKHLNRNGFSGIHAHPFNWNGDIIYHTLEQKRNDEITEFNPKQFVKDNFEVIAEF